MYPGVTSVEASAEHRLLLRFDNGETRVFDVRPLLTVGRFQTLVSLQEFRKVRLAFDTVEWENGLDLDPEYLYDRSEPVPCERAASADREHAPAER
jgi:hypothetical protein